MNNPTDTPNSRADELRSDIDGTRRRMDETINALAGRMKGRHLLDEVVGYFRTDSGQENAAVIKDKITNSAGSAMNSVTDTIKSNPWPALLIGAGVAWMIYNSRRSTSDSDEYRYSPYEDQMSDRAEYEVSGGGYGIGDVGDVEYGSDIVGEESSLTDNIHAAADGISAKVQGARNTLKERAGQAKGQLQAKASEVGERVRQGTQTARARAGELGTKVQERSRQMYNASRERVVSTANQHPVEIGLGCLALGILAGLAIPTPEKVNQTVGPRVDRLREQARQASQDLLNRGRHVVRAAADAARHEVQEQGLTPEALRGKAQAVADRAKEAAQETAKQEGVMPASA